VLRSCHDDPPPRPSPARGEGDVNASIEKASSSLPPCGGGPGWGVRGGPSWVFAILPSPSPKRRLAPDVFVRSQSPFPADEPSRIAAQSATAINRLLGLGRTPSAARRASRRLSSQWPQGTSSGRTT